MAGRGGIEIEADVRWQSGEWRLQRALWVLGALILSAAAAGLFGDGGPLATAHLSAQGFTLEYERFDRRDAPSEMVLGLESTGDQIAVELDRAFAERIDIEQVVPEPHSSTLTDRGLALMFTGTAGAPQEITIEYRIDRAGILPIGIEVNGERASATSLVYP